MHGFAGEFACSWQTGSPEVGKIRFWRELEMKIVIVNLIDYFIDTVRIYM